MAHILPKLGKMYTIVACMLVCFPSLGTAELGANKVLKQLFMFLETEAAFPYCNWSIKMSRTIWFGSTSGVKGPAYENNWQGLGHLSF